jgi:glutamine synthetase
VGIAEGACDQRTAVLNKISKHINEASRLTIEMIEARKKCNALEDTREKAIAYCNEVKEPFFDTLRYHVDKLEQLVDDKEWYLPKYRELLFLR